MTTDSLWYKDAVIYEVHVRAFADSNGDGIGDFAGLTQKLPYLQDLGITCLWLLPFYPSPLRDDGYDIADYTTINPIYGTLDDFKRLLDEAHARHIKVLTELVINHTSDQHPWFQRARRAPKGSPERDFYVWSDTDTKYSGTRIIFIDTEKSNWTFDPIAGQYYWHRFFSHQPDLNFDNPAVMDAVLDTMRFWLDMGVDALRLDAIPYLIEREGTINENLPETHVLLKQIRKALDARYDDRVLLAEANQWPSDVRAYFGDGDECQMCFHFPLMPRMFMALRQEERHPIVEIMNQTPEIPENCQWAIFLRNHDELTLEMVTDEERDYMYAQYAADPQMRLNLGIRRRLAPLMENSRRRIELMNSLLFSMPGTPIIYYGDEIGMGDNVYLGDRNGVRTPMQWSSDRNAGFSRCDPARLYFPVIMDPVYGYEAINVEAQDRSPFSLLHWMKRMIAMRRQHPVFGRGSLEFVRTDNRKVITYVRRYGADVVLCVANLSRNVQPVEIPLQQFAGLTPVEMLGQAQFPRIGELPYFLTLPAYGFYWFQLQEVPAAGSAGAGAGDAVDGPGDRRAAGRAGALRRRRVGCHLRRQHAHHHRATRAGAVPPASALVRRQGAAARLREVRRLGHAARRRPPIVPHSCRGAISRRRKRSVRAAPGDGERRASGGARGAVSACHPLAHQRCPQGAALRRPVR
jgi:maltose alpha-D-glucosyltransferase / alpha-amylase